MTNHNQNGSSKMEKLPANQRSSGKQTRLSACTVAIPVFGTRISSRIDCAESFLLVLLDDKTIKKRKTVHLITENYLERINMLIKLGPDVVICGGLWETCANKLKASEVHVIPWVQGEVDDVLSEYLNGDLTSNHFVKAEPKTFK